MSEYGTFYGVGVGPGDPELITLKAKKVLGRMRCIFTPATTKHGKSRAYEIAKEFISPKAVIKTLFFPMTIDTKICTRAWGKNAEQILSILMKGVDAAFITLGDPMTYSTYGYLLKTMQSLYPHVNSITIPGVSSYAAVAASANLPLVQGKEVLTLIPGNTPRRKIQQLLSLSDTAVFIKHSRNTKNLLHLLGKRGRYRKLVYVNHCGFEDQVITSNPSPELLEKTEYLSLLIVKKSSR